MLCSLCTTHRLDQGTLCPTCTRDTLDRLYRLPRLWTALDAWLTPGTTGSPQYGGRVRRAEAPLPLNQEVLTLRAAGGIVGVLEDWLDAVCHERGLPTPVRASSLTGRVTTAARELGSHIHFIALWEQGGTLAAEVRRLVERVRQVVEPGPDPDQPQQPTLLGYCIAVDPSGVICGARIYADMTTTVQCTWCLCPYPPDRWLALRHHQPGRTQPAADPGSEDGDLESAAA